MSGVLDEVRRECKIRGGRENTWRRSSIEEYFAGAKSWQILLNRAKLRSFLNGKVEAHWPRDRVVIRVSFEESRFPEIFLIARGNNIGTGAPTARS